MLIIYLYFIISPFPIKEIVVVIFSACVQHVLSLQSLKYFPVPEQSPSINVQKEIALYAQIQASIRHAQRTC